MNFLLATSCACFASASCWRGRSALRSRAALRAASAAALPSAAVCPWRALKLVRIWPAAVLMKVPGPKTTARVSTSRARGRRSAASREALRRDVARQAALEPDQARRDRGQDRPLEVALDEDDHGVVAELLLEALGRLEASLERDRRACRCRRSARAAARTPPRRAQSDPDRPPARRAGAARDRARPGAPKRSPPQHELSLRHAAGVTRRHRWALTRRRRATPSRAGPAASPARNWPTNWLSELNNSLAGPDSTIRPFHSTEM